MPPANSTEASKKRKRKSNPWNPQKKPRVSQKKWEVRGILAETEDKYLIDWADDEETGESYSPTWEPKRNANKACIIQWENKRKEQQSPPDNDSQRVSSYQTNSSKSADPWQITGVGDTPLEAPRASGSEYQPTQEGAVLLASSVPETQPSSTEDSLVKDLDVSAGAKSSEACHASETWTAAPRKRERSVEVTESSQRLLIASHPAEVNGRLVEEVLETQEDVHQPPSRSPSPAEYISETLDAVQSSVETLTAPETCTNLLSTFAQRGWHIGSRISPTPPVQQPQPLATTQPETQESSDHSVRTSGQTQPSRPCREAPDTHLGTYRGSGQTPPSALAELSSSSTTHQCSAAVVPRDIRAEAQAHSEVTGEEPQPVSAADNTEPVRGEVQEQEPVSQVSVVARIAQSENLTQSTDRHTYSGEADLSGDSVSGAQKVHYPENSTVESSARSGLETVHSSNPSTDNEARRALPDSGGINSSVQENDQPKPISPESGLQRLKEGNRGLLSLKARLARIAANRRPSQPTLPAEEEGVNRTTSQTRDAIQNNNSEVDIHRQDFVPELPTEEAATSPSAGSRSQQQDAQVVPVDSYSYPTELETDGSILPTTEFDHIMEETTQIPEDHSTQSSSQRNKLLTPSLSDASVPPHPGSHSLGTTTSLAPGRPPTPPAISSGEVGDSIEAGLKAAFTPGQTRGDQDAGEKQASDVSSAGAETQSSSTPDKSPAPSGPPSLRTTALRNSAAVHIPEAPSLLPEHPKHQHPASHSQNGGLTEPKLSVQDTADHDSDVEMAISGHSTPSMLLLEDVNLLENEYIVPLSMGLRQKATYLQQIKHDMEALKGFNEDPEAFTDLTTISAVFEKLKNVETHTDFVFAESADNGDTMFDINSSSKFRFLKALLDALRDKDMHFVLVVKEGNEQLCGMVARFLQQNSVPYKYPKKPRRSWQPQKQVSPLRATLLTSALDGFVQPSDAIICLDGARTEDVRKEPWARSPMTPHALVPVLQLVIPRTVSHIELSMNPKLEGKERLHTIVACLAQIGSDVGRPLGDDDIPGPDETAALVAGWLVERGEWPLSSIHSVEDVLQFSSQSSDSQASTVQPSHKRPLDDEPAEPSKRPRLSSQAEGDTTHVSDSAPGTASSSSELSKLRAQLDEMQHQLENAQIEVRDAREQKGTWEQRQTAHEDLAKENRRLRKKLQESEKNREFQEKMRQIQGNQKEKLQEQLAEKKTLIEKLEADAAASTDENRVELARVRAENETLKSAVTAARKSKESTENTMEYLKAQSAKEHTKYAELKAKHEEVVAKVVELERMASGEMTELKKIHFDNAYKVMENQIKGKTQEVEMLKKLLEQKEAEVTKLKSEKKGYGTRGSSVPRSPRVTAASISRGASPAAAGGRNRLSDLRNG
ncbi:hypothetical protein M011DRAFT_481892 [Sporormia fimetaria CBS 119925]|uniref:Chromo domain-containing protein n=1 Tax=Sporormia fimetaria CBS 119925 TaxID=1340428 RepID=A0A6A6UWQ5_9PLEO|nr:hypothetical protein M011DRAFT_481892 [Sporormia fimetaria CBS 119925]